MTRSAASRSRWVLARLALVGFGLTSGVLVLVAVELLLVLLGAGAGPPGYDPFQGFSASVPLFERTTDAEGVAVLRVSPARLPASPQRPGDRAVPERGFLAEKPPNGFRVFVVGGSAAAGFPYPPAYAFPAWLERLLQAQRPDLHVEVINAALPGYSSRRVLIATREIATPALAPDLVVVMSGHNEWAEQRYYSRLLAMDDSLFALRERLFSTRLFTLLSQASAPAEDPRVALRRFMEDESREFDEMFAVRTQRVEGSGYATAGQLAQRDALYRSNLAEIARTAQRSGARVAFVTLSQNFADWAPGASTHRPDITAPEETLWRELFERGRSRAELGDCTAALEAWGAALEIDPEHAELRYHLGQCHRARGDTEEARAHLRRASDLDRVPHGAPTYFNDIMSEVALQYGGLLVDAYAALEEESDDGLVGDDLFVEFAHPNLRAHQRIASEVSEALRRAEIPPGEWTPASAELPGADRLYAEHPELRARERDAILLACALARRSGCAPGAAPTPAGRRAAPSEPGPAPR